MTQGEQAVKRRNLSRCLTYLKPEMRFVLDKVGEAESDDTRAETIRELLLVAFAEMGYDERRIKAEYLRFALQCAERGEDNPYELTR